MRYRLQLLESFPYYNPFVTFFSLRYFIACAKLALIFDISKEKGSLFWNFAKDFGAFLTKVHKSVILSHHEWTFATELQKPFGNFATENKNGTLCFEWYGIKSIIKLWKKRNIIIITIATVPWMNMNIMSIMDVVAIIITMKKGAWSQNSISSAWPSSFW